VWAIWRNAVGNAAENATVGAISEHSDPFAKSLSNVAVFNYRWIARHGLTADAVDDRTAAAPLALDFNRLKTSIEVRHTRQMGGAPSLVGAYQQRPCAVHQLPSRRSHGARLGRQHRQ
jgi:hypothetical protein